MTPVPMRIRSVTAARAADRTRGAGRYPESTKWCSVVQIDS